MESLFYLHAILAVICMAFAMIIRHTVHALLAMIGSLLFLAVSMYILSAPMAASLLVIVYAGAIMVLFAFAIMLLQVPVPGLSSTLPQKRSLLLPLIGFALFWSELSFVLRNELLDPQGPPSSIKLIAQALFVKYGYLVELCSMLLLAGLAAAVYVGVNFMAHARPVEVKDS